MGASGYLGSHVTQQLVDRGDDVHVWVRPTSSSAPVEHLPVTVHRGDPFDREAVIEVMRESYVGDVESVTALVRSAETTTELPK